MLTESEKAFEEFCQKRGLQFERIKEEECKTPDYYLILGESRIVVEIKQFDPDHDETSILDDLTKNPGKMHIQPVTPGDGVRRKIKKAALQIKGRTEGRFPSLLVLFNNRFLCGAANDYEIRVGMYGFDSIVLAVPHKMEISPNVIDRKFGGKRQMTEKHNTSISGIGLLSQERSGHLQLQVFHNIHAKVPLPLDALREAAVPQFTLKPKAEGYSQEWVQVG